MEQQIDIIRAEIKRRALDFVCDNPCLFHLQHQIETAMLIGASVVFETPISPEDNTSAPSFGETIKGDQILRHLFGKEEREVIRTA